MQKRKIQFVITDVDGVIFDRMPVWQTAFAEMLFSRYGIPKDFSGQYYYETAGIPLPGPSGQLAGILKIHNISFIAKDLEDFVEEFIRISHRTEPKLFSGVEEVLKKIKTTGRYLLASSGSYTEELEKLFAKHNLPYDFFLGSDEVRKGDEHIELLAAHFSLSTCEFCKQAFYVGDGPKDMELGKRNGIYTIGITNTVSAEKLLAAGASSVINNITEILDYL